MNMWCLGYCPERLLLTFNKSNIYTTNIAYFSKLFKGEFHYTQISNSKSFVLKLHIIQLKNNGIVVPVPIVDIF